MTKVRAVLPHAVDISGITNTVFYGQGERQAEPPGVARQSRQGEPPLMTALFIAHKKLVALGLTALTAASIGAGTMFTGALFTDQETDQSTFTTGTITLDSTKIAAMDLTSTAMM